MKDKIVFNEYTQTFRLMPYNYWLASIKDNKLVFDSWDRATKDKYKSNPLLKLKVKVAYWLLKVNLTNIQ